MKVTAGSHYNAARMPLTSMTAIAGFGLMALGTYSTFMVRKDHAAYRAENLRRRIVEGRVARYQYSSINQDDGNNIENYRPIVKYVIDYHAYEIPMPRGDRSTRGPLGQIVPVAVSHDDPSDARFLEPRGDLAAYTTVAMALGGLVLVVTEWLEFPLF